MEKLNGILGCLVQSCDSEEAAIMKAASADKTTPVVYCKYSATAAG